MTTTPVAPDAAVPGTRREQILATAAELFAHRGFNGVSINDIGAAVGISGPALYRHFPSKDAVLGEMLLGISRSLLTEGSQRRRAAASPSDLLPSLIEAHVEFALSQPALITVYNRDIASLGEDDQREVRRLQRAYVEIWVGAIRDAVPGTDEQHARSAAHATFGLINSTPHSARIDRAEMAELLTRMATAALLTPGTLPRA
ncbi:SACE_7040 family transcriptional regulator [Longivirga aurantiaca]|uniref:TetR/AcrR family transcriptional regulator n=1 Tax=Longivirga aurantiaca TaxID=1837743 RepID=A0ABW1SWD0_9ACTN